MYLIKSKGRKCQKKKIFKVDFGGTALYRRRKEGRKVCSLNNMHSTESKQSDWLRAESETMTKQTKKIYNYEEKGERKKKINLRTRIVISAAEASWNTGDQRRPWNRDVDRCLGSDREMIIITLIIIIIIQINMHVGRPEVHIFWSFALNQVH